MSKRSTSAMALPRSSDLPGLHQPLNYSPGVFFPSLIDKSGRSYFQIVTLRELSMMQAMNSITDKPGWEAKVFDDAIAEKWKQEAISTKTADITEKMMDYVIAELRWKVPCFKKTGAVVVYNGDVVKSDSAIPADLKAALRAAVKPLEDIPDFHKDYHPGSNGQVLDLVHPSLFPLIYGRSRVLEDQVIGLEDCINHIGDGTTIEIRNQRETQFPEGAHWYDGPTNQRKAYSRFFQWLPCDVNVSGGEAKIVSYINNLHPQKHAELYSIIGQIITKSLPLWNMTLSSINETEYFQRISFQYRCDPDPERVPRKDRPQKNDGENDNDYWERYGEWERATRKTVMPEPDVFPETRQYPEPIVDLAQKGSVSGLQVIVKLANIELTPEKPEYAGGSWHVEGHINEHICATALYYYDSENITDSYLAFRQVVDTDQVESQSYPQEVHEWVHEVYGCESTGPAIQDVGGVLCKEDRLLTFPNTLQHQLQPFKLADPSKPGHRKILALFLVDPNIRIIGTANVPPQQRDWWGDNLSEMFAKAGVALGTLSTELKDEVFARVDDFPIGLDEAKEIRLKLMEERVGFALAQESEMAQHTFSLCEH